MDSNFEIIKKQLIKYPFLKFCFEKYIDWIFSKSSSKNVIEFPLIYMLLSNNKRLQELEDKLARAKEILGLNDKEFVNKFGFQDELLTNNKEKIHDILAEPLFVLDLDNNKFKNIEKLSKKITKNGKQIKLADFKAEFQGERFAIELKTTMTENNIEDGKSIGGNKDEAKKMLLNNCLIKIEEKNQRVFEQLNNTCKFFNCTKKMIGFYNRKLQIFAYLGISDLFEVAQNILRKYRDDIDYLVIKNYGATEVLFYPALGSIKNQ